MLSIVPHCPLCAVKLQTVPRRFQSDQDGLSWLSTVRAVVSAGPTSICRLTGVGYVETEYMVVVPSTETTWYYEVPHMLDHLEFVRNNDAEWVFPFHARCWDLLQLQVYARLGSRDVGAAEIAQKLFQILFCTPWHGKTADCGHDYGGALSYQRQLDVDGAYSALLPSEYSFLTGDPSNSIEISSQASRLPDVFESRVRYFNNPGNDRFSWLPEEVLYFILASLDSRDLCNLRYSSRSVAVKSTPMQLPQAFWLTRFNTRREMEFALAGQSMGIIQTTTDWRNLYFNFKEALSTHTGVMNRKRIWHSLENLSTPIVAMLEYCPKASRSEANGSTNDLQPHESPAVAAELSCLNQSYGTVQAGTRVLTTHHLSFPASLSDGAVDIGVSFLRVNGRLYVSGLRFWYDDRSTLKYEVGVIVPAAERVVHLHDWARLSSIEVSLTAAGITGLRFLMPGADSYYQDSIGDFAITNPNVGFASLRRTSQTKLLGFWVKFDACRLVSIALSEERIGYEIEHSDLTNFFSAIDSEEESYRRRAAQKWFPTVPSQLIRINSVGDQPRDQGQTFHLQMNIEFAADRRSSSSLQRIVALLGRDCIFFALRFVYEDRLDKIFGSTISQPRSGYNWNCHESTFLIDGAGGERITSIKVGTTELDYVSFSGYIELHTNSGRYTSFGLVNPAIRAAHRVKKLAKLIPIPPPPLEFSEVIEAPKEPEYRLITLMPPPEYVVSGFITSLGVFNRGFLTFGLQSRPQTPNDSKMPERERLLDPPRPSLENKPSEDDPFGFVDAVGRNPVWTAASLQRLRAIYISSGAPNRSRGPESISGLWLEYDSSTRPEIVGQWIEESKKFEIPDGAEIVKVSIWSSVKSKPCLGRPKMGHVVKLQFVLSNGRSLSFGKTVPERSVRVTFRANSFEKLDTISWAFGHLYDVVRITYSQQPCNSENRRLKLEEFQNYPWVVPERIFCLKADSCKSINSNYATAIEISKASDGISGLAFRYTSDILAMVGCSSEQVEILHLHDGDKLSKMEMTWTDKLTSKILESLILHTIKGQIMIITGWKPLSLPCVPLLPDLPPPPRGPVSVPPPSAAPMPAELPPDPPFRLVQTTVFILDPSQIGSLNPKADRIVEFPEEAKEFVGLWGVTSHHMNRLSSLGPIFRY